MVRRARRKGRREKDGAIQLDEYSRGGQDAFSDEVRLRNPNYYMADADTDSSLTRERATTHFKQRLDVSALKTTT